MQIIIDKEAPALRIAENARGLVVFFQEHEGPAGPIPSRTEKWIRAASSLDATTLVRQILELGSFTVDPDLDSLIIATATRQGEQVREEVEANLHRNGVLAAEIFPDGRGEIRVSSMLSDSWDLVTDALEDVLFSTRVRAGLNALLPGELEDALERMAAKVQIASAQELGGLRGPHRR